MKKAFILILIGTLFSCTGVKRISIVEGHFKKGNEPYYFIGANYWYGPIIASEKSGNRTRLIKELDLMDSLGIDNLRILVGAEGGKEDFQVKPALQYEQGKYNEDLLDGLDFLLNEMRKRKMYAVLYLNNNWIWSGGMSTYLNWNGYGNVPNPFLEKYTWEEYMNYTEQFHTCQPCLDSFYKHIAFILGRKNNYNGEKYSSDKTIMSWQVANEPRIFSESDKVPFKSFLDKTVRVLDSLAPKILISTGAEGKASYLQNIDTYKVLHANPKIDYLTAHMWPKNWGWYKVSDETKSLNESISNARSYIKEHIDVAKELNKPIVISEFGFPRNSESLKLKSNTGYRDEFYESVFQQLLESAQSDGFMGGVNFWGFAGYAKQSNNPEKWREGDDFTADPPQEPQGLNSVYAGDKTTLQLIEKYNSNLN